MAEINLNEHEAEEMIKVILDHVRAHKGIMGVDFTVDYDGSYVFSKSGYRISISQSLLVHVYLGEDSVIIFPTEKNRPMSEEIFTSVEEAYARQERDRKSNFLSNFGLPG